MVTPYNSLSVLQETKMLSTVNLGVDVNSFPINSGIRYAFNTLGVTNCSMSNLQPTEGNFNYSDITNILDYAKDNQLIVRVGTLIKDLPDWFTTMSDQNTVLRTLNTHVRTVVTYFKTNYSNIIEYELINDVFDNSGYKTNFLNSILSGSNVVSTVFATANSVLGYSSRVKLLYNHSNAEEGYSSNTLITTLSNFKYVFRYPIDGISLNLNANSNVSFLKIENSIINIININYSYITLNSVSYSIPDTSIVNLNEQAKFYKALIEIKLNYNTIKTITLAGFNDSDVLNSSHSVLFSNSTPKPAYNSIIDLYNTYDWNWLNIRYNRTINRNERNNPDRFIIIDNPVLRSYSQPTITPTSNTSIINLAASSNIIIPNDYLGLSQTPYIVDPYNFKTRHSYINLINLFKLTKKSNLGMRFRCFLGLNSDQTFSAKYSNKKTIERLNESVLIGAKCALQLGTGNITRSLKIPKDQTQPVPLSYYQEPNLPVTVYNKNISDYVNTVDDIVSDLDGSIFETIEIFNEPDILNPQMGYIRNNLNGVNYYKRVYKSIITELNKNSKIGDKINLGSYATPDYYNNPSADPTIDLNWLSGKVNSVSFHSYPAGSDENLEHSKLCRPSISDPSKCIVLDIYGNAVQNSARTGYISKDFLTTPPYYLPTINNHKFRKGPRTLQHLMNSPSALERSWKPMIDDINNKIVKPSGYSGTYPYGFHLNEMNTIAIHGQYGVSDIFGSALWVINWSLYNALINIRRINLHALDDTPMPYNMIDYPDNYDLDVPFDSIISVRPIYYGYWFTHAAMRCGSSRTTAKIMDLYVDPTQDLRIWKLNNSSENTFVVIYYNDTVTINCRIRAPIQSSSTTGKVIRLLSRYGIYGTSGITFGNLSLDGTKDGKPYNVTASAVTPITLTENGIDSALHSENFSSSNIGGVWCFTIPIQSPSALILRV